MVNSTTLREKITFQVLDDEEQWQDLITVYAALSGLRNSEYWVNYAGGNAEECLNISVRYNKRLMDIIPQKGRIIHGGVIYELITPPDDVLFKHREIKFKARRQIS
ncbi:MAG: head-tail adaptor protein [Oscillospiraceae bacterium]|nr:head-tail adaptor protein [Oscillospiraceae bacterium]